MFKKYAAMIFASVSLMLSTPVFAMEWNRKIDTLDDGSPVVHALGISDNTDFGFSFSCSAKSYPLILFMVHQVNITENSNNIVSMRFNQNDSYVVSVPFLPQNKAMLYNLKKENGVKDFFDLLSVMDVSDTIEIIVNTPSGNKYGKFTSYGVKENFKWVHDICKNTFRR